MDPLYCLLALLHLVCPLLFFTDLTRNPYATQIYLLQGGLCLMGFLGAVSVFWRGEFSWRRTPLDKPIALFLGVALLSWGLSWVDHLSLRPSIFHEGLRGILFLLINATSVFYVATQLQDPQWARKFRIIILAVGALAAAYGVAQYNGVEPIWPKNISPYNGRPVSTFGNPNFLSSYLVMLLPVVLAEFLKARSTVGRVLTGSCFWLYGAALVCTMTRSSWIGAAVALGSFLWLARVWISRRIFLLGVLLVGLGGTVLFWPGSSVDPVGLRPVERMTELVSGMTGEKPYGSWHQRLLIWSSAWDMVQERPGLGKGWGCFELFYPFYQGAYLSDKIFRSFRTHANNAHNLLLEVWSQVGGVGLLLFLWMAFLFFELARRRIPALPEDRRLFAWAFLSAGLGMVADNFFGNVSLFFAVPAFLFFWMMGSLAGDLSSEKDSLSFFRGRLVRGIAVAAALFCVVGVGHAWRSWRADIAHFQGAKAFARGDVTTAIASMERSRDDRHYRVENAYDLANIYTQQFHRAREHGFQGEIERTQAKALKMYDEALSSNGGYDEIYFNRAMVLSQTGRREEAILDYRTVLLINPLFQQAYGVLGGIYLSIAPLSSKVVEHFRRAVFYFPQEKDFWINLGYAYSQLGRPREALGACAKALRLDPQNLPAWANFRSALVAARIKISTPDKPKNQDVLNILDALKL
jgi:putative inorganic carbon (HCO3(-)) transporter